MSNEILKSEVGKLSKMKFQKTIDLWSQGVQEAIQSGALKLQTGQWVVCGAGGSPSRYVATRPCGSLWVAHSEGKDKTTKSFARLCNANKVKK